MKSIYFRPPVAEDMVRAILEGRKTVTRRAVKPQPEITPIPTFGGSYRVSMEKNLFIKPPYRPDDILYVRETWYYESHMEDMTAGEPDLPSGAYSRRYIFKADFPDYPVNVGVGQHGWRPSIHMPREAARIFLKVNQIEVQQIKDIADEEANAEGFASRDEFIAAFLKMYPDCTEDSYCWVISFEKVEKPKGG